MAQPASLTHFKQGVRMFRRLIAILVAGIATNASLAFSAAPASASIAECTNGANGFVSIAYNRSGAVIHSVDLGGGRRAELHRGLVNGVDRGWAKITGSTRVGDKVWLDWSTTGGNGWLQCGPWSVNSNGSPNTSAAQRVTSDPAWVFRACGIIVGGTTKCTPWW